MHLKEAKEKKKFQDVYKLVLDKSHLMKVGTLLWHAARNFGDTVALIYVEEQITFMQLYQRARTCAQVLKNLSVKSADRVVISFENSPDFYVAYFAAWQVGAVVVPLNTFLKEYELAHIIADAKPVLICTSSDKASLFSGFGIALLTPSEMVPADMDTRDHAQIEETFDDSSMSHQDEVAVLLYTSGTTGTPKGVMLSSSNIMSNMLQVIARLEIDGSGQRVLAVLPLFHVFAQNTCVWIPMIMGCTIVLVQKIDRRLILDALKYKPTLFLGVPALYGLLCLLKTAPLESVEYFVSGGDALPDKISTAFSLIYRRKICNGYGLTETSPVISVDLECFLKPTGFVGRPVVNTECVVCDEHGHRLKQGEIGELWVSGPQVMLGYYNQQELTDQVMSDGFFKTGDLGYCDKDGAIIITGRLKDLIISKGVNIYPQEIENVLLSHTNIIGAAVIGQKDDQVGEVPIAFVQLRQADESMPQVLRLLCLERLATYKVPQRFICSTESLPMTATAKVDKKVLRERLKNMY